MTMPSEMSNPEPDDAAPGSFHGQARSALTGDGAFRPRFDVGTAIGDAPPLPASADHLDVDPVEARVEGGAVEARDATFDPGEYHVDEVLAYLDAYPEDRDRVLNQEADGKARVTILNYKPSEG